MFVYRRLPFDHKTSIFTYLIAFALQALTIFVVTKIGFPIMCIMVESFLILSEFIEDIRREITALNENWKMNQNQAELMQKLSEIIWFNTRYNQLSLHLKWFVPLTIYTKEYTIFLIWFL